MTEIDPVTQDSQGKVVSLQVSCSLSTSSGETVLQPHEFGAVVDFQDRLKCILGSVVVYLLINQIATAGSGIFLGLARNVRPPRVILLRFEAMPLSHLRQSPLRFEIIPLPKSISFMFSATALNY
jgi:hypothetical protein